MDRSTPRRKALGTALALLLVAGGASPARANLWTGACALRLTIAFDSEVRPPVAAPTYQLEGVPAADLDVATPGVQPCATTFSGSALGGTAVEGSGTALAWSCGGTVAVGSWRQSFDPEGPAEFTGTHALTGTWGAWTLHVQTPTLNVVGVGEMTLDPADVRESVGCAVGSIDSVTMVGVLVFQDP